MPLPIIMICEALGVPTELGPVVRPHVVALSRAFRLQLTETDRRAADEAVVFLREFIERHAAPVLRRGALALDESEAGVALSADDVLDNLVFLLFASFETTSSLIATGSAFFWSAKTSCSASETNRRSFRRSSMKCCASMLPFRAVRAFHEKRCSSVSASSEPIASSCC